MSTPSSLSQGLALLGVAVERERSGRVGHNASRLADATGIERSRVSRLTQELRALGYLERDEAAVLSAGDAYFRTAAALDEPWLRASRRELRMLASRLRMSALITAAAGAGALLLRYETGVGAVDAAVRPGMITPIWCTGSGRALLWEHTRTQLDDVLRDVQFVGVGGPAAARSVPGVAALLERDRAAGVITADDEYAEGITEYALPIHGPAGIIAAIAVIGPSRGTTRARSVPALLHDVRDRLSAAAGGR